MSEDTELSVVEKRTYKFIYFLKHLNEEKKRASEREEEEEEEEEKRE